MQPLDLIGTANLLANQVGKPKQANLKRAQSTAYYALFHCLAKTVADLFVGGTNADRSKHAWRQAYRAVEHGYVKGQCKVSSVMTRFPKPIEDFANLFVSMQIKRHAADYDPSSKLTKTEVVQDIRSAEQTIKDFLGQPIKDRRAFCVFVVLKTR